MANVIESEMYVAVNPLENNNKMWRYFRYDNDTISYEFGRVGGTTQTTEPEPYSEKKLLAKIKEKTADKPGKRYQKVEVVAGSTPGTQVMKLGAATSKPLTKDEIARIAANEIGAGDPVVIALVKKLAEANRHELQVASGGELDIDLETGIIKTAVGVVTADAINQARVLLDDMVPFVKAKNFDAVEFVTLLGSYLKRVPQKTHHAKGWHRTFISTMEAVKKQTGLLDQLETSISLATQRAVDAAKAPKADGTIAAPTFEVKLKIVSDKKILDEVNRLYKATAQSMHSSSRLKVSRVYEIDIPHMSSAFEADGRKVGGIKMLWHGTRMFNVLSIMKRGLIMPKTLKTMNIAGAMFGDGLYFSDQSTKSLNYATGFWGGGGRDTTCFMFLVDVAMGKSWTPSGPCNGQKSGYDSCYAVGGKSGVMNNEMIVYRTSQANPRYLVEFSE
jgi:poly [ADP-ribose] polymerase